MTVSNHDIGIPPLFQARIVDRHGANNHSVVVQTDSVPVITVSIGFLKTTKRLDKRH
jgi:hypothetical protein